MSETPQVPGTAVGDWLLPGDSGTRVQVERAVHQSPPDDARPRRLRTLSAVARRALAEEVEIKLRLLLGDTFTDLLNEGWRGHATFEKARRNSLEQPGVDQVVTLGKHQVVNDRDHSFEVQVDGVTVLTLAATVKIGLELTDSALVVRDGHVTEARSGQVSAFGRVTLEGIVVAERRAEFPLTAALARD